MIKNTALSIFILLLIFSCKENKKAQKPEYDLIISNANIVDVQNDRIQNKKFIAIKNDTIQLVGDMENLETYSATETHDAENNYVMPGLWDMHVHFRGGDSLIAENKELLSLFLAYGATSVRDCGGDISPAVLDWKNQIAEASLDGPEIFTAGPKLDGPNPAWEGSIKIEDETDIENALDSLESMKVDFVKMYDGSLSPESFYGIIEEAEKRGLKTTGHMPLKADFSNAINHGLDGIEHMYYTVKACSTLSDSLSKTDLGYGMMPYLIETFDKDLAEEIYKKMASEEVSITPTLYISKVLAGLADDDHSNDSLRNYVGMGIQKTYQGRIESAKRAKASGSMMRQKMEEQVSSMIVPMFKNGVKILAGSDSGAFNSFVYSGESLHSELEELVNSGLTPAQSLQTSIVNGPGFFGLEDYYGSLEKGKIPDIIILKKNPLEDIKNTRSIKSIIKNNKIYTPGNLLKTVQNPS